VLFIQVFKQNLLDSSDSNPKTSGSLEEFSRLMQGELVSSSMEKDLRDSFAVFRSDSIGLAHLKHMMQVLTACHRCGKNAGMPIVCLVCICHMLHSLSSLQPVE
jgi:Ca2+-binding EF-hand superfamily protein